MRMEKNVLHSQFYSLAGKSQVLAEPSVLSPLYCRPYWTGLATQHSAPILDNFVIFKPIKCLNVHVPHINWNL